MLNAIEFVRQHIDDVRIGMLAILLVLAGVLIGLSISETPLIRKL